MNATAIQIAQAQREWSGGGLDSTHEPRVPRCEVCGVIGAPLFTVRPGLTSLVCGDECRELWWEE